MSTDIVDRRSPSLAGTAFAGLRLLARPGLVLTWVLAGLPAVLFAMVAFRVIPELGHPLVVLMFPLAGLGLGVTHGVLAVAAYRAVLRPEQSRFAYLRLSGVEARVFFKGQYYGGLPTTAHFGLFGVFVVLFLFVALTFSVFGQKATFLVIPTAIVIWGAAILAVTARASMSGVAAFVGRAQARQAGWDLAEGHTVAIIAQRLLVAVLWLAGAAVLLGGWWSLHGALARPSVLFSPGWPGDLAGWIRFGLEGGSLAVVLSLIQVIGTTLGSTATAMTWVRLGGERETARRRSLFADA